MLGGLNSSASFYFDRIFGTDFHDKTWWERDASERGWEYMVENGHINPRDPGSRARFATLEDEYNNDNPREKGRWWEFLTLPFTWTWRY